MSKRRKKKTLLANQKPKRRWSFSFGASKRILGYSLAALLSAAAFYALYYRVSSSPKAHSERPALSATGDISPAEQNKIMNQYRQLSSSSPADLQKFSEYLYKNLGLRSVQLIQTTPDRLVIGTEPFQPSLIAEVDKLRYVTADGIVFGLASAAEGSGLPILRGLYRNQAATKLDNGSFSIGEANQRIVDEALLAIQEATRYNIKYRSLNYDEFRGLSGELLEPSYRVTLGFKPFDATYVKLQKIIDSLKERGLSSATIELDYKGKAFVKDTVL